MTKRDDVVTALKERLDRWNLEATKWEARVERARDDQLAAFHAKREEALYQMKLLENASGAAFDDVARGAEKAWAALGEAFDAARSHFEKSPRKSTR